MIDISPYLPDMPYTPEQYQVEGTSEVVNKPLFFLADKPGAGKTKQVIDAACVLYAEGIIDTVVVACPAQVKINWLDQDFGEIQKHNWAPSMVTDYSSARPIIPHSSKLVWVVTSIEFARSEHYKNGLINELSGRKVLIIIDESSYLENWKSLQHKAWKEIVHRCADRAVILNGTPGNPIKVYGQFEILDSAIIGAKNYYHFEARYVLKVPIQPGSPIKKVVDFTNKDLLDAKIKPYILRREPKLNIDRIDNVISSTLTDKTWKVYKQMRDSMLVWLGSKQATAPNAMVKSVRLAQITSGMLGGIGEVALPDATILDDDGFETLVSDDKVAIIGDEKQKSLLEWVETKTEELEGNALRLLVWCRFRPEVFRMSEALRKAGYDTREIVGGQSKTIRGEAVTEFTQGDLNKPMIILGQHQAGGMGLNLITCHYTLYLSNAYSHKFREQTEHRTYRKGQKNNCFFTDMIATGPQGQKTIDHHILLALKQGRTVAEWTVEDWRRSLSDE